MQFPLGIPVTGAQLNAVVQGTPQLISAVLLTFSSASITIAVPAGYSHLWGAYSLRSDTGSGGAWGFARINNDSGSNYTWQTFAAGGTSTTAANAGTGVNGCRFSVHPGVGDTANYYAGGTITVSNVSTGTDKAISSCFQSCCSPSLGYVGIAGGVWNSSAAVSSVGLWPFSGNWVAGSSFSLYGIT